MDGRGIQEQIQCSREISTGPQQSFGHSHYVLEEKALKEVRKYFKQTNFSLNFCFMDLLNMNPRIKSK